MRRFNPDIPVHPHGKHWIEAFRDRAGNGQWFGYEAEYMLPSNIHDVRTTLQQIEYFDDWFFRVGRGCDSADLPEEFGPGQPIGDSNAKLIDFSADQMVFRHGDAFFVLTLQDYGPAATLAKLRCFDYNEKPPSWLARTFGPRGSAQHDQSNDITNTRSRLIRLGHLTADLKIHGHPVTSEPIDGKTLEWVTWHTSDGTLHVLPDEQGAHAFEIGQCLRTGKIGYVVPEHLKDSGEPERFYIERWALPAYGGGKIVHVSKNHGDPVLQGDRILLLER